MQTEDHHADRYYPTLQGARGTDADTSLDVLPTVVNAEPQDVCHSLLPRCLYLNDP